MEEDAGYTGPILPGGHRFDKKLICIRYPGNVVNADKAVETLGGIGAISTVRFSFTLYFSYIFFLELIN